MRKRLILSIMITVLFLVNSISPAFAASVSFSHSGPKYIWSNFPEEINSTTGKYTIEETLSAGQKYDVELYHTNYSGSTLRIGAVFYNPNSTSATITKYGLWIAEEYPSATPSGQAAEQQMCATVQEQVRKGSGGGTTITIPAYGYALLMYGGANGKITNGKAIISSNLSNVKIRVFHGPPTDSLSQIFGYVRDTDVQAGQSTGFFQNNTLTATVDANNNPNFVLAEYKSGFTGLVNSNEYQTASNGQGQRFGGIVRLAGNYGKIYTVTVTNASGKRLKITPTWGQTGMHAATIALKTPQVGNWFYTNSIKDTDPGFTYDSSWFTAINSNSYQFSFALPGSNFSNVKFAIVP